MFMNTRKNLLFAAMTLGILLTPTAAFAHGYEDDRDIDDAIRHRMMLLRYGEKYRESAKHPCIVERIDKEKNEMVVRDQKNEKRKVHVRYADTTKFRKGIIRVHENAVPVGAVVTLQGVGQPDVVNITINNNQDIYIMDDDYSEKVRREERREELRREREEEKRERDRRRAEMEHDRYEEKLERERRRRELERKWEEERRERERRRDELELKRELDRYDDKY